MKCDNVKKMLPFLDDGSLDKVTREKVIRHCVECSACRDEYLHMNEMLKRIRNAIQEERIKAGPDYIKNVYDKIDKREHARRFSYRVVSAAAVVLCVLSLSLWSMLKDSTTVPAVLERVETENTEEFEEYIVSKYITGEDLEGLVESVELEEETSMLKEILTYNDADVTPEEIIELMDEDELSLMFASLER